MKLGKTQVCLFMYEQLLKKGSISSEEIKSKLKENGGYCPCRLEQTEDTKCPCKEFRGQEDQGECHCGLYYKV